MVVRIGTCSVCSIVTDLDQFGRVVPHPDEMPDLPAWNSAEAELTTIKRIPMCPGGGKSPWGSA